MTFLQILHFLQKIIYPFGFSLFIFDEIYNESLRLFIYFQIIMPKMFSSVKSVAKSLKSGLFLTEFGICVPDGNPNSINTLECDAVMDGADTRLQSWTYWNAPQFFDEEGNPRNATVSGI